MKKAAARTYFKALRIQRYFLFLLILGFSSGCSSELNNPISKGFHNTTAHYNAYWIAEQLIDDVEVAIDKQHQENYNSVLKVFSEFDTVFTKTLSTELEDCIKKSSLVVQRHPNSQWLHPSYVLIGKARFYSGEYTQAIETFKYVNTKSDHPNTQHEALVNLMRTFLDYNEKNNAIAVSDYLKKEKLNKKNLRDLYLTRAYMFQADENYNEMVKNLVLAVPLISNSKKQARIYFIIGQIYQKIGFTSQAYSNYQNCLKNNPEYELFFYTRLNMAQVSDLADESDIKKIRKYFTKLLNDTKNEEFRDKIYYEMGEFEVKQHDLNLAIEHYKSSVSVSQANQRQKAYSFLRLGQIHYDSLKKYELAKAYYDSTIAVLPVDEKEYDAIKKRQEILSDFVEQLTVIQHEDSLQQLAKMDTVSLSKYLDEIIVQKEAEDAKKEIAAKKQAKRSSSFQGRSLNNQNPFEIVNQESEGKTWYFDNAASISVGQSEFIRIWGNRPLEDNWRRSQKQKSLQEIDQNPLAEEEILDNENSPLESEGDASASTSKYNKQAMMATIPFSEEMKKESNQKIEVAHYKLGNIYYFNLEEKDNAIVTFNALLNRFPMSEYIPEILYQLFLIYQEQENDLYIEYRDRLVNNYPKSSFAKIIINPNYLQENNAANEQAQEFYKQAYDYFQVGDYAASSLTINKAISELPENDFTDNLKLLQILMIAPTENIYNYQSALGKFMEEYPESDMVEYAQELAGASRDFVQRAVDKKGAKFIDFFEQSHYFVLVFDSQESSDELNEAIVGYVKKNFPKEELKTSILLFNDTQTMILVDQFKNQSGAEQFYQSFNGKKSPVTTITKGTVNNFVISRDNFQIFYQTKDLSTYLAFFEKHYL